MQKKLGLRTHLKVKRTLKGIISMCRCRFFHTPTKQVLLIFCHFEEFFTTEDYLGHTATLINKSKNTTHKHVRNNNSRQVIIRAI